MKKNLRIAVCIILALAMVFALVACGDSGDTGNADTGNADAGNSNVGGNDAGGIQDTKNYSWSMSAAASTMPLMEEFVEFVKEKTEGHIEITLYDNNSFGSVTDILTMVQDGTLDMFYAGVSQFSGVFNVACVCDIPFLYESIDDLYKVNQALIASDYLDKEMRNDKLTLAFLCSTDMQRMAIKEGKIESIDDFKGLKIRNNAAYLATIFEELGAVPTSIRVSEVYMSLETGVIDAAISSPESQCTYSYNEICQYEVINPLYGGTMCAMMNTNTYNSMSDEMKGIWDELCAEFMEYQLGYIKNVEETSIKTLTDGGIEFFELPADVLAELETYGEAAQQQYADNLTSLGFDGDAILELVLTTLGK